MSPYNLSIINCVSVYQEKDSAVKKIADYKSKVTEVKQSGRKDITALQARLAKVKAEI